MESNTIIIQSSVLKKALNEAKVSLQEHPHILNMGILKSVNKRGIDNIIETDKDHYFVHLSFQEYFAARYLIDALKGSQSEKAIQFIKNQKYNQRYTLAFTFAAGLLSESDANPYLKLFWDHILGEPLDLVGIRHFQLVISCLEETNNKSTFSRHAELLQRIAICIQNSFMMEDEIAQKYLLQSLKRAQSVACDQTIVNAIIISLQQTDNITKKAAFSFISKMTISNPSIPLMKSVINGLNDREEHVRANACDALGNMGEKAVTNEVITKLVSALGDQSKWVGRNACKALVKMGEKAATNEVITKLVSALGDQSSSVRANACEALKNMGEKAATNEVITKLVSALGDQSAVVRRNAREALVKMGEKAATNEVITTLVSSLRDHSYDVKWDACEALENMGEKAATNEVISQLLIRMNTGSDYVRSRAVEAVGNILSSSAVIKQLAAKIVADLCLCRSASYCLKNISEAELMSVLLPTENPDWVPAVIQITFLNGTAVTATENKIVLYGKTEPAELPIPDSILRQQLIDAFLDKRLYLSF
jgi:HEAT repeat protein